MDGVVFKPLVRRLRVAAYNSQGTARSRMRTKDIDTVSRHYVHPRGDRFIASTSTTKAFDRIMFLLVLYPVSG